MNDEKIIYTEEKHLKKEKGGTNNETQKGP